MSLHSFFIAYLGPYKPTRGPLISFSKLLFVDFRKRHRSHKNHFGWVKF